MQLKLHPSQPVKPTGITVKPATNNIDVGATRNLTVEFDPADTSDNIMWSSSDESIATVAAGVVTGVAAGQVNVTATTDEGLTADVVVSVAEPEPVEEPTP